MSSITVPRCVISGVRTGSGTTLLSWGLVSELRKAGLGVSVCIVGSSLQRAIVMRRLSGRYVHCLDPQILSRQQMLAELYLAGLGANLVLIVGSGGLFDGGGPTLLDGSPAQVAGQVKSPVILVAEAAGFGHSLAALVQGYSRFAKGVQLGGVILNRMGVEDEHQRLPSFFHESFEFCKLPPIIGMVPERSLSSGTVPPGVGQNKNCTSLALDFLLEVGDLVGRHVDASRVVDLAAQSRPIENLSFGFQPRNIRTRIAVSEDVCFAVSYQTNLELLRYFGAKIVPFSPLADVRLPRDLGGVYLTGAFLADYAEDLQANRDMAGALREFAKAGGVIYAEGAASAYLCREFQTVPGGARYEGVGLIPAVARAREPREGYLRAALCEESVLGARDLQIAGICDRQWSLSSVEEGLVPTLNVQYDQGEPIKDGWSPGAQMLCTFGLLNFASEPHAAMHLVNACEVVRPVG